MICVHASAVDTSTILLYIGLNKSLWGGCEPQQKYIADHVNWDHWNELYLNLTCF